MLKSRASRETWLFVVMALLVLGAGLTGVSAALELARAELREETGLRAAEMRYAGRLFLAYGFCTQANHVFLATGLTPGEAALEVEEQDLVTRAMPLAELEAMIRDGVIEDQSTVAAFGLLRLKGLL